MTRLRTLVVPILVAELAAALGAQAVFRTGHPQHSPHSNTGQTVPLSNHYRFAAGRSQIQLGANMLPAAGAVLVGIEAHGLSAGRVTYRSLQFTVSPIPSGWTPSAVFADNLPQPTTVLRMSGTVAWQTDWQTFMAAKPYVHDGRSALTIDIQKLTAGGGGAGTTTGLHRPGTPTMLVAFGDANSNRHTATRASIGVIPIDLRLLWRHAPTLHLASPTTPLHHGFAVGSHLDLTVETEPGHPGLPVWCLADAAFHRSIQLPGVGGLLHIRGLQIAMPALQLDGTSRLRLPIPKLAGLPGTWFVFQAMVPHPPSGGFWLTNAADCVIGK